MKSAYSKQLSVWCVLPDDVISVVKVVFYDVGQTSLRLTVSTVSRHWQAVPFCSVRLACTHTCWLHSLFNASGFCVCTFIQLVCNKAATGVLVASTEQNSISAALFRLYLHTMLTFAHNVACKLTAVESSEGTLYQSDTVCVYNCVIFLRLFGVTRV